ncbi:LPS-assembly protein LptD [Sagittula salina]|nr:LPS assembly protein LptD [Sagittula salina]
MARVLAAVLAGGLCTVVPALPAFAQDTETTESQAPALLIADNVFVDGEDTLVATGNVEALQGDYRLTATKITYDRVGNLLTIDGPIRVEDPENGVLILADQAEVDQGFMNGLIRGARMVIDQQLQLAAVEARRVDGRYTQLSRVSVSSCQVCGANEVPLWQIRASRVIHDQQERQLYLDDAQVRLLDVPVFWLPRLRLPDPTLDRARGFLFPTFTSSTLLGFGVKVPYFIPIGDSQDVTLAPHLTTKSKSLEARYRRAFRYGKLTMTGAISGDDFRDDGLRGYLFAEGTFRLPRNYTLKFTTQSVSDPAYLNDYNITSADRLVNTLEVGRVARDRRISFGLESYYTLRDYEENATQPGVIATFHTDRRFLWDRVPGEFRLAAEATGLQRDSTLDVDGPDADAEVDGRDSWRLSVEGSWQNRWTFGPGLRLGAAGNLFLDHYVTDQDAAVPNQISRATPGAAVELRWPLMRVEADGARSLLEPVAQIGWVGGSRGLNANEESTRVEFDEANLLSLSRYPAADRREHGTTYAAGLRWLHEARAGWTAALTLGRIWQDDIDPAFSRSSGLDSLESDWLIAGRFTNPMGMTLAARGLLDEQNRFTKAEARAGWSNARMDLGASYVLLTIDPDEGRNRATSEWTFDSRYEVTRNWETTTEIRYDLVDRRLDRVGLGLQYRNECIQVGLGATRTFASSTNLEPSTDIDLTVALSGFGVDGSAKEYRRTCR